MNAERIRLQNPLWKKWGPYVSERQWGTVREDYSPDGAAWDYFPHDMARSRAYRWGEDGIAGLCDDQQTLCLSLALWNGADAILKERFFGLSNPQGNHGEDVKEIYYFLDATPTHSYMKMLYKYPQAAFPYQKLIDENRRRSMAEPEFELIDSGIFDQDRYFDVFVEYAKAGAEDILMKITVHNRGPQAATLQILPQLFFRNTWSWGLTDFKPEIVQHDKTTLLAHHETFGANYLHCDGKSEFLFCENETNVGRVFGVPKTGVFKDGINDYVVNGRKDAIAREPRGSKAAVRYIVTVAASGQQEIRLRLSKLFHAAAFGDFENTFKQRQMETQQFYEHVQAGLKDDELKLIQRQAFAGMLWSKQFYYYDIPQWLDGDKKQPPPPAQRRRGRNQDWRHLNNADIISMPDTWEYPWYAAWDLAFHCIPLALIDAQFAKDQLLLLTREWYMHPNGQLPAYEWALGDVNPPVHAWATWRVFQIDRSQRGDAGDIAFLERVFHKLMLNFTWWVNRKDAQGRNIFQGGFLGLDNIGVFDRSAPLPTGGHINQADATSWMAMYCLNLMRMALELALHNPVYEDIATKFFEHFLSIADAMNNIGDQGVGLWDPEDEFYYDELSTPDRMVRLKVRSMVGLIPLFAVETLEPELLQRLPEFKRRLEWFLNYRPELANLVSHWQQPGRGDRRLLSLLRGHRMKCLLRRMLDPNEFLSDFGIRALSKYHEKNPYCFDTNGMTLTVKYVPGESDSGLFGGNSNWRGPIWMPVNYLLIESLQKFHHYYGDDFKIECPTGSGQFMTILQAAHEISRRLINIFRKNDRGERPLYGTNQKLQRDPHFRDHLQFFEYFHGDSGRGVGASHQTGWTGLVAKLIQPRRGEH